LDRMPINVTKKYPEIGVCGLDCGLCPRYYTEGPSRCQGCGGPDFLEKHPSCSPITCCVIKKGLETCGECRDFPCPKFKTEEEYQQMEDSPSYPPRKRVLPNLWFIKEHGIEKFVAEQRKRIDILETMLKEFNDGRSRSFYCRAATTLPLPNLKTSVDKANQKIESVGIKQEDLKSKAKIFKEILNETSREE